MPVGAVREENQSLENQRRHPQTLPPPPSGARLLSFYFSPLDGSDFKWPPLSCSSEAVATVDVHAAKRLVYSGHRYLDVRTVEEFKKGHLENAINVPYLFFTPQGKEKNPKFVEQVSLVCDKDDRIIVGCLSGVRSLQAAVDLLNSGFKHVQNMGGGYAAWIENGFAVKKPQEEL